MHPQEHIQTLSFRRSRCFGAHIIRFTEWPNTTQNKNLPFLDIFYCNCQNKSSNEIWKSGKLKCIHFLITTYSKPKKINMSRNIDFRNNIILHINIILFWRKYISKTQITKIKVPRRRMSRSWIVLFLIRRRAQWAGYAGNQWGRKPFSAAPSFRCFNLHKELFFSTAVSFCVTGGRALSPFIPFSFFFHHFNSPPTRSPAD